MSTIILRKNDSHAYMSSMHTYPNCKLVSKDFTFEKIIKFHYYIVLCIYT